MRTVVIGAAGQLGTDLLPVLPGVVIPLDLPDFDITRPAQVRTVLHDLRPDWVVNCAAQTNVDGCEADPAAAFAVNAAGALHVAQAAAEVGAAVAYISTDYVFGGAGPRGAAYTEDDPPAPVNTYGVSKLAGEQLTRACNPRALIVRSCGLYGHAGARGKGGNFVETMLRLAAASRPLRVVDDQCLSPTATRDCAAQIAALLACAAHGIVHVAAHDACTWFEFAHEILAGQYADADLQPISSAAYGAPARRPAFSALRSGRLAELGLPECRTWREMLHDYLAERARPPTGQPNVNPAAGAGQTGQPSALEISYG